MKRRAANLVTIPGIVKDFGCRPLATALELEPLSFIQSGVESWVEVVAVAGASRNGNVLDEVRRVGHGYCRHFLASSSSARSSSISAFSLARACSWSGLNRQRRWRR